MARMGSVDLSELKKFQQNLEKMADEAKINQFCEECAKELAARLLAKVIKRTPVGDYTKEVTVTAKRDGKKHKKGDTYTKKINPSGRKGGTLRRGWTTAGEGSGSEGLKTRGASQFVDTLKIHHFGNVYVIEIKNQVPYASYVEFGHRTANHNGWVKGHFMMTVSENEIRQIAPRLLEKKMEKFFKGVFRE